MENIWLIIEPYLTWFVGIIASSGILSIVGTFVYKKLLKKVDSIDQANTVASAVVSSIANKDLKISLENVNEKNFAKLEKRLLSKFEYSATDIADMKSIVASMAVIMSKFKAVTEEEKTSLIAKVNSLQDTAKVVEEKSEPIVVTIEPVKMIVETSSNDDLDLF